MIEYGATDIDRGKQKYWERNSLGATLFTTTDLILVKPLPLTPLQIQIYSKVYKV
jgi:hypothetical protein